MLTSLAPGDAQTLRSFFDSSDYTDAAFKRRPVLQELPSQRSGNLPVILYRTSEPTTLNTLLRLFVLAMPMESDVVAGLIPSAVLAIMLDCGVLRSEGELLVPAVMLTPCDEFLFAADTLKHLESGQSGDLVLWPNPTTRMLQVFSMRRPIGDTLDLGSGCGVQAVLASRHSERVVATDLNPRAEEFTRFNASLNGVMNIECFTGDTFEPLEGRKFDLILANPPFFVTPEADLMYCENPMELDGYCRRVVKESPHYLNEGGYLQMTCEWVQVRGQSWQERVSEWVEGSGCDAWVLRTYGRDAAGYAHERLSSSAGSPDRMESKFDQWMAYYKRRNVEEIHGGFVAIRRRSGDNWVRIEEAPLMPAEPFGDGVLETFHSQTILSSQPTDAQLLELRPRLAQGARLEQRFAPGPKGWVLESLKLVRTDGLPASLAVESQVAEFLRRCDGTHTLAELVKELAAKVNASPLQVSQQCCAVTRRLAERRFVLL